MSRNGFSRLLRTLRKSLHGHGLTSFLHVTNHIVAGDALAIINYINAFTAGAVPANARARLADRRSTGLKACAAIQRFLATISEMQIGLIGRHSCGCCWKGSNVFNHRRQ